MAESNENRITKMLLSKERGAQYARLFVVMAACVAVAVAVALHQTGVAMTHKEQVLTCPVDGIVAHAHNESCYDKQGNLVCPLPERELHTHTDDCYTETQELVCDQEESENHKHNDDCYIVTRELTCGKEEAAEEHVHGPGCFTTVEVNDAEAEDYKDKVLACPVEGVVAHKHDDTCYDKDGRLVCTLPERELHEHTDSCYAEKRELTCGQEESKNHTHTADCYSVTSELVCGKEEAIVEHVHGPGCFVSPETKNEDGEELLTQDENVVQDDTTAKNDDAAQDDIVEQSDKTAQDALVVEERLEEKALHVQSDEGVSMPAQQFDEEILDDEGNVWVHVSVTAPKGAFPKGTTMHIAPLDEESVRTKVEDALKKDNSNVTGARQMKAVDISFKDADGNDIEPAVEVEVKLTSDIVRELSNPTLVHVDKNKKRGAEVLKKVDVINQNEQDKTKGTKDTLKFESDAFSPYVIVEPSIITADVITAGGKTYKITVSYGEDAGIGEGAKLKVKEITEDTEEYWDYYNQTAEAMGGEGGPSHARFFDIEIQVDGKKVEPAAPVETTITYVEGIELDPNDVVTAVHFSDKGKVELMDVDANSEGSEFKFEQESFSVTGIATSPIAVGDYIIYSGSKAMKTNLQTAAITVTGGNVTSNDNSVIWHFEVSGSGYKIYYKKDGSRKYLRISSSNSNALKYDGTSDNASIWTYADNKLFTVKNNTNYYVGLYGDAFALSTNSSYIALAKQTIVPQGESGITVHYVDESGNILAPIEKLPKSASINDDIDEPMDIVKAIDGKTYHNTYIGSGNKRIQIVPELKAENDKSGNWQYQVYGQESFTTINTGTDIYVVYGNAYLKDTASGGSGSANLDGVEPQAGKVLTPNEDGTYTLSLNVTAKGKTENESNGANVILILDTSNSMDKSAEGSTRFTKAVAAAQNVSTDLLKLNTDDNPKLVEMCLVEFNWDVATSGWYTSAGTKSSNGTYPKDSFNRKIADAKRNAGTNWEGALQGAIAAAKAHKDGDQTYIIFLTDGNPSSYTGTNNGNGRYDNEADANASSSYYYRKSPNYMHATDEARQIVQNGWYFYSVGMYGNVDVLEHLTKFAYTGRSGSDSDSHDHPDPHYYKAADTNNLIAALSSIAKVIKNTIGLAGVVLNDGIATDVTHTALSAQVGGNNTLGCVTYEKTGGDTSNYKVTVDASGVSTFAMGSTTKTGAEKSITYKKTSGSGDSIKTENATAKVYSATIGNTTYQMPMATLDNDGNLQWDLSPLGELEPGATYKISFVVWPDQEAYDYVADLNNGKKSWDTSTQETVKNNKGEVLYYKKGVSNYPNIVKYADGTFAALTNTHQNLDYYVVDEKVSGGNTTTNYYGSKTQSLEFPSPMGLTSSSSKIQKEWNAELQKTQIISFLFDTATGKPKSTMNGINFSVRQDKQEYMDVLLGWDEDKQDFAWAGATEEVEYKGRKYTIGTLWEEDFAIANGLMVSAARAAELKLDTAKYASGTYNGVTYYILEDGHDYQVVEPELKDSYAFDFEGQVYHPMLVDGVLKNVTFKKDGKTATFTDIKDMNDAIRVSNTLRGGINLKKVVSNDASSTQQFTFAVTLTNESPVFKGEDIPWYSINGSYYHGENGEEKNVLEASDDGKSATVTIDITQSDSVRIANVPNGTTYTIEERIKSGYELEHIDLATAINDVSTPVEEGIDITNRKVTSTIVQNRENNVTFTNKRVSQVIRFRKVAQDVNYGLEGAEFTLKIGEVTHTLKSDKDGNLYEKVGDKKQYTFELPMTSAENPYEMTETVAPDGYVKIDGPIQVYVDNTGVTAKKSNVQYQVDSPSEDDDTDIGTILIPNSAGEQLPATGGTGTATIYAMGAALVGVAAFGLTSKKLRNNL